MGKLRNRYMYYRTCYRQWCVNLIIKRMDKKLALQEHESQVLEALNNLGPNAFFILDKFLRSFPKPRGCEHNLVYLWPKKVLDKRLKSLGVAVGPVPNYRNAFLELSWRLNGD